MPLPSSIAWTIELKLSSVKTISAASLATSVPVMPMAMPMSAFFNAGASLTPSPVIAMTFPIDLSASTMAVLWDGLTRAKMLVVWRTVSRFFTRSNCSPVMALPCIPRSWAIALAVVAWSPVIMMTLIPAVLHCAIAVFTCGLAGSIIACRPTKMRSVSDSFADCL